MVERLCDFRENNLISPLGRGELEFVFGTENLKTILEKINNNKYGSYLIGGAVGTGKSSLINIVLGQAEKKILQVNIKFYSEIDSNDNFLRVVMEELIASIDKDTSIVKGEELNRKIAACKRWLYYDEDEQNIEEQEDAQGEEAKAEVATGIESNISAGVKFSLSSFFADLKARMTKEKTKVEKSENRCKKIITRSKREENRIEQIISLINELNDVKVVLVYDELDKMNIDILETWFAKYKNLFLEKNFFNFFLVSNQMYARYSNSDFWMNPLYTCFSGVYYMKLLGFEDTLKYCCMIFSNTLYGRGLAIYYNTLGNYRLINVRTEDTYNYFVAFKGYILKEIIKTIDELGYESHFHDILVGRVKRVIEAVTIMKDTDIEALDQNWSDTYDVWPRCSDIKNMVIEEIRALDDKLLDETDGKVRFNRYHFMEKSYDIFETIQSRGRDYGANVDLSHIHVRDMYRWIDADGFMMHRQMTFLSKDVRVKKVGENRPENYGNILMKIILANLHVREMQVVILERERGNESFYIGDIEYTGIVFAKKEEYTVAYYVDRGSYKSECYRAIEELIEGAKKIGVSVKSMKIDKYMNVERDISEIIERYNKL